MSREGKSDYSLWLSPTSNEAVLSDLILDLSRRSTPPTIPFAPHATLLSDSVIGPNVSLDEIKRKIQQAASQAGIDRVVCKFDSLEAGKLFYQCVYIKLRKNSESEGLLELHRALRRVFNDTSDPQGASYFPHFSLVYGDLDASVKDDIIRGLLDRKEAEVLDNGLIRVADATDFEAREILIVKTAGATEEWEVAGSVALGGHIAHEDL